MRGSGRPAVGRSGALQHHTFQRYAARPVAGHQASAGAEVGHDGGEGIQRKTFERRHGEERSPCRNGGGQIERGDCGYRVSGIAKEAAEFGDGQCPAAVTLWTGAIDQDGGRRRLSGGGTQADRDQKQRQNLFHDSVAARRRMFQWYPGGCGAGLRRVGWRGGDQAFARPVRDTTMAGDWRSVW